MEARVNASGAYWSPSAVAVVAVADRYCEKRPSGKWAVVVVVAVVVGRNWIRRKRRWRRPEDSNVDSSNPRRRRRPLAPHKHWEEDRGEPPNNKTGIRTVPLRRWNSGWHLKLWDREIGRQQRQDKPKKKKTKKRIANEPRREKGPNKCFVSFSVFSSKNVSIASRRPTHSRGKKMKNIQYIKKRLGWADRQMSAIGWRHWSGWSTNRGPRNEGGLSFHHPSKTDGKLYKAIPSDPKEGSTTLSLTLYTRGKPLKCLIIDWENPAGWICCKVFFLSLSLSFTPDPPSLSRS